MTLNAQVGAMITHTHTRALEPAGENMSSERGLAESLTWASDVRNDTEESAK